MTVDEARTAIAYTAWANRQVLDASRPLNPDDLTRDLRTSFGSVRGTLYHILGGEWMYFRFWLGQPREGLIGEAQYPDVDALSAFYETVEALHATFLSGLTDETLAAKWTHPRRGTQHTLGEMLQHVVIHGAYHRGQVAAMLRQLGYAAPATDFILFSAEAQPG